MMRSLDPESAYRAGLIAATALAGIVAAVTLSSDAWDRSRMQPPRNPASSSHSAVDQTLRSAIQTLMVDLGADTDHRGVPVEFVTEVERFVRRYQGPDRKHMTRALGSKRRDLARIRTALRKADLHPDLAFIVLVESSFLEGRSSRAGAAGPWQFTPGTAQAFGLRMSGQVDERHDARKSTRAACEYLRQLMRQFGGEESVMLALVAYNYGSTRVRRAVETHSGGDFGNREYWALYRSGVLPEETQQYVPKLIAAMLIGRDPARFGFRTAPLARGSSRSSTDQVTTTGTSNTAVRRPARG